VKIFLLFALAFVAAWMVHQAIVPNVVPVADSDEQTHWQGADAFVLLATQNIGLGGVVLVVVANVLDRLRKLRAR
jgi:hypothetical protein